MPVNVTKSGVPLPASVTAYGALICKAAQKFTPEFMGKFLLFVEQLGIEDKNHPIYIFLYLSIDHDTANSVSRIQRAMDGYVINIKQVVG